VLLLEPRNRCDRGSDPRIEPPNHAEPSKIERGRSLRVHSGNEDLLGDQRLGVVVEPPSEPSRIIGSAALYEPSRHPRSPYGEPATREPSKAVTQRPWQLLRGDAHSAAEERGALNAAESDVRYYSRGFATAMRHRWRSRYKSAHLQPDEAIRHELLRGHGGDRSFEN
jgi:hypothetical protein